jgi:hypothetical protein
MATTLQVFFKTFRESIQSNKAARQELNKEAIHYVQQDIDNFKSQLSTIGQKLEQDFNTKYAAALQAISEKGMSDVTFGHIQENLKVIFIKSFEESLKDVGVEVGHVQGNLTLAAKTKATAEIFNRKVSLSQASIFPAREDKDNPLSGLSDKDRQDIAKTLALISTFTQTLEELDQIQSRAGLIAFLKKSLIPIRGDLTLTKWVTLRNIFRGSGLGTIGDIEKFIEKQFGTGKGTKATKGFTEIGQQILDGNILTIEVEPVIDFKRKITSREDTVAVTFEVKAFNQLKGKIANGIKNSFTDYLDALMLDSTNGLSKKLDEALAKAITETLTDQKFLEIFPNVSASKTLIEVVTDQIVSALKGITIKPYASEKTLKDKISTPSLSIKIPPIKIKTPKAKSQGITLRTQSGQFYSLASLQQLINSLLAKTVKENMGTGTRSDILNLRTGRFAESAKVERMTQSRDGMITAFYSYMRNPYGTFSQGGRQESPKSRDPKLLISKSIRQIAELQVRNRLRAVLV